MSIKPIAIYHRVMRRENFETAAQDIFRLVQDAQRKYPDVPRILYVDIDGHRNSEGGFDDDMFELQKEFMLGFLLPFCKEVYLPLGHIVNTKEQDNNVPDMLVIGNERNEMNMDLNKLYIEDYTNTEFMSEEDVFAYLQKVSEFLRDYDQRVKPGGVGAEAFSKEFYIVMWHSHMKNLMIELFNSFLYGNLLTATAMTRTLIESYMYCRILQQENRVELYDEWYLCGLIKKKRELSEESWEKIQELAKQFCNTRNFDFEEKCKKYSKGTENSWLTGVIPTNSPKEQITISKVRKFVAEEYGDEDYLDADYQAASAYIHGQDIWAKMSPFTFYEAIYSKLYKMMVYIFKTIRLFSPDMLLEAQMQELEKELLVLGKRYLV